MWIDNNSNFNGQDLNAQYPLEYSDPGNVLVFPSDVFSPLLLLPHYMWSNQGFDYVTKNDTDIASESSVKSKRNVRNNPSQMEENFNYSHPPARGNSLFVHSRSESASDINRSQISSQDKSEPRRSYYVKRRNSEIKLNIYDLMQSSLKNAKTKSSKQAKQSRVKNVQACGNTTRNSTRKGKQKENSSKKPTTLKKIILKERESRKQKSMTDWQSDELKNAATKNVESSKLKLHNRSFREYCDHLLSPDINREVSNFLKFITRFQQRAYEADPVKARCRRRFVIGIRETTKHIRCGLIKCVIIAPNCECVRSEGGLDEAISTIINYAKEQNILYVFALNRMQIGICLSLKQPVSMVGVLDHSGAEIVYKKVAELVEAARADYRVKLDEISELSQGMSSVNLSETEECDDVSLEKTDPKEEMSGIVKGHSRNLSDSFNLNKKTHARNYSGNFDLRSSNNASISSEQRFISHSRNGSSVSDVSRTSQPLSDISPYSDSERLLQLQNEYHSRVNIEFGCENVLSAIEEFDTGNEADSEINP